MAFGHARPMSRKPRKYNDQKRSAVDAYLRRFWSWYFENDAEGLHPEMLQALVRLYEQQEEAAGGSYIVITNYNELSKLSGYDWRTVKASLAILEKYKYTKMKQEGYKLYIMMCVSVYCENFDIKERKEKRKKISPAPPFNKENKEKKEKGVGKAASNEAATHAAFRSAVFQNESVGAGRQRLQNEIAPYVQQYGREMCNEFYAYWAEPTQDGGRLRFQLQKTWSTAHRLSKWKKYEPAIMREKTRKTGSAPADRVNEINKRIEEQERQRERKARDEMRRGAATPEQIAAILGHKLGEAPEWLKEKEDGKQ